MDKKIIKIIIIFIILIAACAVGFKYSQMNHDTSKVKSISQAKPLIEVASEDDLRKILKEHVQPSILFIHRDGCGWCEKMSPVIQEVAQNKAFGVIQFYGVNEHNCNASALTKELINHKVSGYPEIIFMNKHGYLDNQSGYSKKSDFELKIKRVFYNLIENVDAIEHVNEDQSVKIQATCGLESCKCCCGVVCGDACSCV